MSATNAATISVSSILNALKASTLPESLYKRYIAPLSEYDKYCGTDYMDFLSTYLKYDGHIKTIAEKMFVHRNTVHYRIKKIEELLECDLSRLDTKMNLLLASSYYNNAKDQPFE